MSDLLSLLSLGSAGIAAQNTGVSVATNNVANVNTQGYSRQRVDLEALRASPLIGGVRSGQPDRLEDRLLAGRLRSSSGSLAHSEQLASGLGDLEATLSSTPTMHEHLGGLFSSLGQVAADPSDPSRRGAVIAELRSFITDIRRRASELADGLSQANVRIDGNAADASSLAERLAASNRQVAQTNDPVARDERDRIATALGKLVGGDARIDADGQMRYVLDGGAVLVDGGRAAKLVTTPDPVTGNSNVVVVDGASRRDVTATLAGGKIGADLSLRDKSITGAIGKLDQFASDVATSMNAVHSAGAGIDGISGRPMFVPPTQVAGAAAKLAIDPALDANPDILATGTSGAGPGDNRGALALFGLATSRATASGNTLTGAALDLVAGVGAEAAEAKASVARDGLVDEHLNGLRDSLAGVDLQEELTNLSKFEHASSAMTRFVSTIDNLLGDLIDRL